VGSAAEASVDPPSRRCVVFFPGDISDFAKKGGDPRMSLEALTEVIGRRFPIDDVLTVRPTALRNGMAVYSDFAATDDRGVPLEERTADDPDAVGHLEALLETASQTVGQDLSSRPVILVAFSKGGVPLNALLRDAARKGESNPAWLMQLDAAHFVDVGLPVPGAYPLSEQELLFLRQSVSPHFQLFVHGTPRQLSDPKRPFLGEEAEAFVVAARAAGLSTQRFDYGVGSERTLALHFDSLACFYRYVGDMEAGDRWIGSFDAGWPADAPDVSTTE